MSGRGTYNIVAVVAVAGRELVAVTAPCGCHVAAQCICLLHQDT